MDTPKYLFHYTSLENLALILESQSIAFNSLLNVDDTEEAQTADIPNFGKYVYVSCWTDIEQESIAMWNLYTPNMQGVRIKLPTFPFRKYHYKVGEYFFDSDVDTFIDYARLYTENKFNIVANQPELFPVTYTRNEKLLKPEVRNGTKVDAQRFLAARTLSDIKGGLEVGYSFALLGKCKREDWRFQGEWRYSFSVTPIGLQEFSQNIPEKSFEAQKEIIRRFEDANYPLPQERYLMKLDEIAIKQMEVVLGPKTTQAGRILAHALLEKYGLLQNCRNSLLNIR